MNHLERHHMRLQDGQRRPKHKRKPKPVPTTVERIKVRLDHRTIITITKKSSLAFWRKRYPNLSIIS